jgi:hypothetical protein
MGDWPAPNDHLFPHGSWKELSIDNCDSAELKLHHLLQIAIPFQYRRAYAIAAQASLSKLISSPVSNWPECYPTFFLCRHAVELSLKAFISEAIRCNVIEQAFVNQRIKNPSDWHVLAKLWTCVKHGIESAGWGAHYSLQHTGRCIQELHNIDRNGQRFRYEGKLDGDRWNTVPQVIDLETFGKVTEKVLCFLEQHISGLDEFSSAP